MDIPLLVEKARGGDREAFGVLYEAYYVPIYRFAFFKTGQKEIAEDIAQSVFVKAFQAIGSFKDTGAPFLAWLYTIARNTLTDYWKRKKDVLLKEESEVWEQLPEEHENADSKTTLREKQEVLEGAMKELSDEQREVVILRFIEERSYKEIAEILRKNEEALRALSYRAMKIMRAYLEKNGVDIY